MRTVRVQVGGDSDAVIADGLAGDGVHILVDLMGLTTAQRRGVTGYAPAPLVVSWLGYPGTTGACALLGVSASRCVCLRVCTCP